MNAGVTAACSKLLDESDRKGEGKAEDWCRDNPALSVFGPTRKPHYRCVFGKHSCCGYFTVPKINNPINTVTAPSNSLPVCVKEVLFVNPLLKTWTEIRLLNTSVGVLLAHLDSSGSASALWHFGSHSTR